MADGGVSDAGKMRLQWRTTQEHGPLPVSRKGKIVPIDDIYDCDSVFRKLWIIDGKLWQQQGVEHERDPKSCDGDFDGGGGWHEGARCFRGQELNVARKLCPVVKYTGS